MTRLRIVVTLALVCVVYFSSLQTVMSQGSGQGDVIIDARVEGCGDQIIESGEECDGSALGGQTCNSRGFTSGSLSCTTSCVFNSSACVYTPPSSGGGGGGGVTRKARVVLTGFAYPGSEVTVLKDAQVVATTIADTSSEFQILVEGLSAGSYIFSIYSEDSKGVRSALFTFPVTVTRGILAKIDSIFVAPTIVGNKIEVKRGTPITFFGQSIPGSFITIEVNSEEQHFVKVGTDDKGVYLHNFDSAVLEFGDHTARSRSVAEELISSQSSAYEFSVGTRDVFSEIQTCSKKADFNADCRVNLVDFSIVAYWYLRTLTPSFLLREKDHLNGDGKINLVDFSIMAFHWTG